MPRTELTNPQQAVFQSPRLGATPIPAATNHTAPSFAQQPGFGAPAGVTADVLNKDIEDLIVATRVESVQSPHDPSVPTRLKALVDLQAIVRAGSLPPDQLVLVKKQVDELSVKMRAPTQPPPPQSSLPPQQPVSLAANVAHPASHISHPPPSSNTTPTPGAGQGSLTIDSLLGKGALAALLAQQKQADPSRNTTPTPAVPTPTPPPAAAAAPAAPPASDPMSLIQQLRERGIIGAAAPPPPPPAAPARAPAPNTIESALASLPPVIMNALTPMKATPPADPREISWDLNSLQVA